MPLGLKIDVDTYRGMKEGVPRLLEILNQYGLKASFFLSVGPDASGLAVLQLIKNPRFLKKLFRSQAHRLYGWKTALYGTILPSPMIALSFPHLVRRMAQEGHEVALHAWDHRRWQDSLPKRSEAWILSWLKKGIQAFQDLLGRPPEAFGAPAWVMDERALKIVSHLISPVYLSCTRSSEPFIYEGYEILEIPSDLPCLEEVGIEAVKEVLAYAVADGRIHVLPVHAEVEGGRWAHAFAGMLQELLHGGTSILTLREMEKIIDRSAVGRRLPRLSMIPGRASPCLV
ncbi:MAG TPA: polysaccharide deacetylase family protein [Syntrophales bacterium]|nr:polysaccharide deacetylase family protein [Syntrophales bacterium]HOL60017.1 polysaccharide deacetylase family protein [Syntrophales bacterium]HPO36156.1 polysaccharide deacetylase family protein [Syntrophales bacterium]